MASDHKLYTEALDQFNSAGMDLLEVIDYLVRTYNISKKKAEKIAMEAEEN